MRVKTAKTRLPAEVLVEGYLAAVDSVVAFGYAHEIDWQERCRPDQVTESGFLREAAWVILSSGMRERVVRERFPMISEAFLQWVSAEEIARHQKCCARSAFRVFRHAPKIAAITFVAQTVAKRTFESFKYALRTEGCVALDVLPYIGPVTRYHLAKNLGMDVVKPDRHLVRLAQSAGFSDPEPMCDIIARVTGDRIGTVDLVLWRYATLNPGYPRLFEQFRP